ncbi:response regulator transcription factor [Amycolatopsis sp. lyj-23]|uniref:helix-turn-helix transcriptional regulator n=1 Tax=Amycolatopsis sp. lyj-23 TaxID=2789283 RepID=UPI00397CD56A
MSVHAADEISLAGVRAMLGGCEEMEFVPAEPGSCADVLVVVEDEVVGTGTFAMLRRWQSSSCETGPRVVLVVERFNSEHLLMAVECGVVALLPRADLRESTLVSSVIAVSQGAALLPYRMQGILLDQLHQLRSQVLAPAGFTLSGIETRERDVLQLIAQGLQTDEIAEQLTYSEGTVKNVLYGLMARLRLNSRSHAVAYAMRAGVI